MLYDVLKSRRFWAYTGFKILSALQYSLYTEGCLGLLADDKPKIVTHKIYTLFYILACLL